MNMKGFLSGLLSVVLLGALSCSKETAFEKFHREAAKVFAEIGLDSELSGSSVEHRFPVGTPVHEAMAVIVNAVSKNAKLEISVMVSEDRVDVGIISRKKDPKYDDLYGIVFIITNDGRIAQVSASYTGGKPERLVAP